MYTELERRLAALEISTSKHQREQLEKMQELETQPYPNTIPLQSHPTQPIPYEQRTQAIIGGLGWDEPPAVLSQLATEVLTAAGVDPASYCGLAPKTSRQGFGSMVELVFFSPAQLTRAKFMVKAVAKSGRGGKPIWLDAQRTRDEMRPARIVHRIFDGLENLERPRTDKIVLTKNMPGKLIESPSGRMGWTQQGNWVWSQIARQRYHAEDLDAIKAYGEQQ
jgi:hypothetical protein